MITINEITTNRFSLNGIEYFKNFTPVVRGDYITIVNTYDARIVLSQPTIYSDFTIDGNTYADVELTQSALLDVVFTRSTLGSGGTGVWGSITGNIENQTDLIAYLEANYGGSIDQDNIPIVKGFEADSSAFLDLVAGIDALPTYTVTEKQIVFFQTSIIDENDVLNTAIITLAMRDVGKGTYGVGGDSLLGNLWIVGTRRLAYGDAEVQPNTQVINLGSHTSTTVEAVFNAEDEFAVQSKTDGLRLVNITLDAVEKQYFFTGVGGDYGTGGDLTATSDQFDEITGEEETTLESGHVFGGEITTNTTLNATHKGKKWFRIIGDVDIIVPANLFTISDQPIFYKKTGNPEFISGSGFRLRGVRDINNRHFFNDNYSAIALIDCSFTEAGIIGNLKRGYTGAVNITSHDAVEEGATGVDITFIGTGFSENMLDPVLSANATFNSWTFVNNNQITINLDVVGSVDDEFTITFDNGDVSVYTVTIQEADLPYDTANLRHYYPLATNSNDAVASGGINGTDTAMTYSSGWAVFDGSTSKITLSDDDSFSYGNGSADSDMAISVTVNLDSVAGGRIGCKWSNGTGGREYRLEISSTKLRLAVYDEDALSVVTYECDTVLTTSTTYHLIVSKVGSVFTFFVDGSETTNTEVANDVGYVAMENLSEPLVIGALSYSFSNALDGSMRRLGFWNVGIDAAAAAAIYTEEVTNNNDLL